MAIRMLHTLDRASSAAPIHAAVADIDLGSWFTSLTSDEFVAASPDHHGSHHARLPDGFPVFVASETIGDSFMTHHYVIEVMRPDHIRAVSAESSLWLPNGEVAPMRTTWELTIEPYGERFSRLVSDVLAESSHDLLVALTAQRLPDAPNSAQAHCAAETQKLALDIERKLKLR
ncbi:MAG TPA: hypothetical protein VGM50_22155 [Gemmatimonadaceae bacterium]